MPKQTETLLSYGGVGLLAIFLMIALVVGWKMLANFISKNQDLVKVLVEENRADRKTHAEVLEEKEKRHDEMLAAREKKHDADRDQWHAEDKIREEKMNAFFSGIEKNLEKMYDLYQSFVHEKK